jgi:hypothetical protein
MTRQFDINLPAASKGHVGVKRETAESCRERASADLLASAAMITANQRSQLQTSAASWSVRANMLQRVEEGIARKAVRPAIGDPPTAKFPNL